MLILNIIHIGVNSVSQLVTVRPDFFCQLLFVIESWDWRGFSFRLIIIDFVLLVLAWGIQATISFMLFIFWGKFLIIFIVNLFIFIFWSTFVDSTFVNVFLCAFSCFFIRFYIIFFWIRGLVYFSISCLFMRGFFFLGTFWVNFYKGSFVGF